MAQRYTSFLIRCWQLGGDERRFKIEHIQSGEWTQVATLAAAVAWLTARWDEPPGGHLAASDDRPNGAGDEMPEGD